MSSRTANIVLTFACLSLLVANVVLQLHDRKLNSKIDFLTSSQGPVAGDSISGVFGTDLENRAVVVDYANSTRPSLLLVFSPLCRYSKSNMPRWKQLQMALPKLDIVFADATRHELPLTTQFFSDAGMDLPSRVLKIADIVKVENRLELTPTTLVIGPKGVITGSYLGVLDEGDVKAIVRSVAKMM
jgi:hypothetical protein